MKKSLPLLSLFVLFIFCFISLHGLAQLTVNDQATVDQIIQKLIGKGAVVSNVKMNCHPGGFGTFDGTQSNIGLKEGIVLTTGDAVYAAGGNTNETGVGKTDKNVKFADPDLTKIEPTADNDPCILEFDIVPSCDVLNIKYVFGSEEYPDFVCSSFNDIFGFFITGPKPGGGTYSGQNIALLPGSGIAVGINSVNNGKPGLGNPGTNCKSLANAAIFNENDSGTQVQYDGFTDPLTAIVDVIPCQKYHIKLAIADAGDKTYDSGVFLSSQGLECDSVLKVDASADVTICAGESTTLTATGSDKYVWSPAAGLSATTGSSVVATPSVTTKYYVSVAGLSGCAATTAKDSVTVTVKACGFSVTATGGTACEGECVNLQAVADGSSGYTYSWSNGSSGAGPINVCPTSTSTYTVTVSDNGGFTATATALVTVTPKPALSVKSASICVGQTAGLTADGSATSFKWSNGSSSNSIEVQPSSTTTYTVTGSNNGCSNMATAVVVVHALPPAQAGSDVTICPGVSATLAASGGTSYSWSPGAGLNTSTGATVLASPSVTTQYIVLVTDSNKCSNKDTVNVIVAAAVTGTVSADAVICPGTGASLKATGGSGYAWSPPEGLNTVSTASVIASPTATTTYTVVISNGFCAPVTKQVTVTVAPSPKAAFGDTSGCFPLTVNLNNASTGAEKYLWDFGDGKTSALKAPDHVYAKPGKYTVKLVVTSAQGCKDSLSKQAVELFESPYADFAVEPGKIDVWNPTAKFINTSVGDSLWLWDFNDDSTSTIRHPKHTFKDSGSYKVCLYIQNARGCSSSICKTIRVLPDWTLYIPNAFTPNGDGINDSFTAYSTFIKEYEMWIFDRWGNRVFHSKDASQAWNGKVDNGINGEALGQVDVYVYRIQIKDIFNKVHKYVGHVSLIR